METFNENPFAKDTPVTVFSTGSQGDGWFEDNCVKCIKNENCELLKKMFDSTDSLYCVIPLWVAKKIGVDYDPLYQQGGLHKCREFRTGNEPF